LDAAAAAGLLGVSERRVRQLAGSGALEGTKTGGVWVFDRLAVEDYRASKDEK
jgi:excisionase family DNA binding protein